jgi:hypothetical protein
MVMSVVLWILLQVNRNLAKVVAFELQVHPVLRVVVFGY